MTPTEARIADALEPTIDIDLAMQRRILKLEFALKQMDHYTLLGLTPRAEKTEIKSAYFTLMREFHTDNFYGKDIGGFGPRLQRIIEALTRANDVLGRRRTREEYDRYLSSRMTTQGARQSSIPTSNSEPPNEKSSSAPLQSGRRAVAPIDVVNIPASPKAPRIEPRVPAPPSPPRAESSPGLAGQERSPTLTPPERKTPTSAPPMGGAPTSRKDAARRRLARKMGGRGRAPEGANGEQVRQAVRANLKARFDARKRGESDRIDRHLKSAMDARAAGDWAAAVNALRVAVAAKPDDASLAQQLEEVQTEADVALAPKFLEQAEYEQKNGSLDRAARSYERAARGKKSPELFNKAAECLLKLHRKSEEDQRKAAEMARQAVALDKRKAIYRITLARAYDAAGMRTSAQGEARRALELEPNNNEAKELLKSLK